MSSYYAERLSAERLRRCYDIAPERVRQYLDAEVDFVLKKIRQGDLVLDLGCGYGRVMARLAGKARWVVGIDTSLQSLLYGRNYLRNTPHCVLLQMDTVRLAFPDRIFDVVLCIQNGISAFHADQARLIREGVRVARQGGTILFSSYSERFWEHRLDWFRRQSQEGLLGEIDAARTGNGVIVCKDGFTASTVGGERFLALTSGLPVTRNITEVDGSSLFCEMVRTGEEIANQR